MGWFDGASEVSSSHSHHHHRKGSSGKHHSSSRSHGHRSPSPRGSGIFGLGSSHHNASTRSFFAPFGKEAGRSSSYYKRSPRSGYLKSIYSKLRRLLRDLVYYMKKHPMKVFMLVIMPLITGGALTGLLAKFGLRLPPGVEKMFGGSSGVGRGRDGGMQFERSRVEASGPLGGLGNVMGSVGGIGNAMKLAKMFM